ncbi:MAG: sulfotransferase family protein [Solirubrobacteraceae bacterium]
MSAEPLAVASARSVEVQGRPMRVPDFFIVGHQKCGTTALYLMLKEHPQIFMSEVKEPRFFVSELLPPGRRLSTLDGYLSLFADAKPQQLVGDASPQYIRWPTAAAAIAEMQPAARIVAILREPVSFLRSFHLQMVSRGIESQRDFRKALALEAKRRQGRRLPRHTVNAEPLLYSGHVRYVEQLERYRALFGEEQMLVLIYDDFRADNEGTVRRLLRFLDVDETVPVVATETKPLKAVRLAPLARLADRARIARHDPAAAGALGRAVNALTPARLHSPAFRARWRRVVFKTPEPPEEGFVRELRHRFKPEVLALGEYLGRDLAAEWGYDLID